LETLRKQAALDGSLEDVFLKLTEEAGEEGQSAVQSSTAVLSSQEQIRKPSRSGF
jgi:hypothetical protein